MRPRLLAAVPLFCALLTLPGCAIFGDAPNYRGNAISQHDLDQLTPGTSTQADATALLGPPTVHEQFQDNNWIYVSQVTKIRIARTEGVQRQHVVELRFDNNGVLQGIDQRGLNNQVTVAMDTHQTPVPGGSAGFFQQLLGGVGYNPLASLGAGGLNSGANGLGNGGGGIGSSGSSGL